MKTATITAAAIAFLLAATAGATPVVYEDETQFLVDLWGQPITWVNFDTFPSGEAVPTGAVLDGTEWASQGLVLTSTGPLATAPSTIGTASSPPNYLSVDVSGPTESLTLSFSTPCWGPSLHSRAIR